MMAGLLRTCFLKRALLAAQVYKNGSLSSVTQFCNFSKVRRKCISDVSDSGDVTMSKKDLGLQQALDQITATFGKGAIMWLGRTHASKEVPVISTGSFSLDIALGIGGLPKGRVVEIYGPEASGKTTLALHVIAEAQKIGGYCAFVDAEHALDPALAEAIGVRTDNLLLSQPDSALVPKAELDGEMGDAHVALQARLMSKALRKLSHSLSLSQTILVFVNQVRMKVNTFGGGFGGPTEVTCGGNALKFYASVRLNIRRIGLVKKGEETVGSQVQVKIVKNKHAPPFKTVQLELEFGKGICRDSEIIELGCKHMLIGKSGGAYYSMNGQSFRGKDAIKRYLSENEGGREELMAKLRERLIQSGGKRRDGGTGVPSADVQGSEEEIIITADEGEGSAVEA